MTLKDHYYAFFADDRKCEFYPEYTEKWEQ